MIALLLEEEITQEEEIMIQMEEVLEEIPEEEIEILMEEDHQEIQMAEVLEVTQEEETEIPKEDQVKKDIVI